MTSFSYIIRSARQEDIESLADIERAADRLFPEGKLPNQASSTPRIVFEQALAESLLFVATVEEQVVGFAALSVLGDYLHLHQVAVEPKFGRQGIGRKLVQTAIDRSTSKQLRGVILTTFSDIPWNAPFYRSLGFRDTMAEESPMNMKTQLENEKNLGLLNRVAMIYVNPLL